MRYNGVPPKPKSPKNWKALWSFHVYSIRCLGRMQASDVMCMYASGAGGSSRPNSGLNRNRCRVGRTYGRYACAYAGTYICMYACIYIYIYMCVMSSLAMNTYYKYACHSWLGVARGSNILQINLHICMRACVCVHVCASDGTKNACRQATHRTNACGACTLACSIRLAKCQQRVMVMHVMQRRGR